MKKEIKLGVIGVGGRGIVADAAHKPNEGFRIVAGADVNPEALKAFPKRIKEEDLFLTEDYRELLEKEEIDAVFITSPDFLHEEHAIAALEAGKAVFLEKPMHISIEGCDRILETAYKTGSKLYLGHNMRHFHIINKMKNIIDSGIIGEIRNVWCRHFIGYGGDAYFKNWAAEQEYSNGLLLQKGAHDIDVIHWLAGSYTKSVVGMGMLSVYDKCEKRDEGTKGDPTWNNSHWPPLSQTGMNPNMNIEDSNMIMMQLENGVQASYLQCHYTPDSERNYTFIGTKGRIENIGDHHECKVHVWTQRGPRETPDIVYNIKTIAGGHGGADPDILEVFLGFLKGNIEIKTSPIAARNAVAVGIMGHQSMRSGCGLQVIPPLPQYLIDYFEKGQKK